MSTDIAVEIFPEKTLASGHTIAIATLDVCRRSDFIDRVACTVLVQCGLMGACSTMKVRGAPSALSVCDWSTLMAACFGHRRLATTF